MLALVYAWTMGGTRSWLLIIAALVGATVGATGCDRGLRFDEALVALELSERETDAARIVAGTDAYGHVHVGYFGEPADDMLALRRLVKDTRSRDALQLIVQRGPTPEGQLMALTGLFELDPQLFLPLAAAFADRTDAVHVHTSGCMGGVHVPMNEVIAHPRALQLTVAVDSIERFAKAHPDEVPIFDIAGGSYASLFLDEPAATP